mmetsp:Transcript_6814/g.12498  ORF Transcript_6814/g.12498 Transcript_6814/m.12498 type:complete len:86 (+) Transcript_6814:690-947(+)
MTLLRPLRDPLCSSPFACILTPYRENTEGAKISMKSLTSLALHLILGRRKTLITSTSATLTRNQEKHKTNLNHCGTKDGSQDLQP